VNFLRRLLGRPDDAEPTAGPPPADPQPAVSADEAEQRHEREVLRAEAERLDELQQRQLRYADYAWEPPAQGGERRADDEDERGAQS
jgi:hypothetical protein